VHHAVRRTQVCCARQTQAGLLICVSMCTFVLVKHGGLVKTLHHGELSTFGYENYDENSSEYITRPLSSTKVHFSNTIHVGDETCP
jgi:hypothetical protein